MMIDFPLVEELIQEAMSRMTLKESFRIKMSTQATLNLLASHYAQVVLKRHQQPKFDEYIQDNLNELAKALTAKVPKAGVLFCGNCGNGKTTMLEALRSVFSTLGDDYFSFVNGDFNSNMKIYDARDIVLLGKDFSETRKIRERDLLAIDDFGKEPVDVMDDIPQEPIDLSISDLDIPEEEPVETAKPILDTAKADTAVMDVLAERQAWRIDRPGSAVKNVISAISLNDRVLLINVLFGEDPMLFQDTISAFNGMQNLDEATAYIKANFPDWDMDSEPVYRLMMAVRRKLR